MANNSFANIFTDMDHSRFETVTKVIESPFIAGCCALCKISAPMYKPEFFKGAVEEEFLYAIGHVGGQLCNDCINFVRTNIYPKYFSFKF